MRGMRLSKLRLDNDGSDRPSHKSRGNTCIDISEALKQVLTKWRILWNTVCSVGHWTLSIPKSCIYTTLLIRILIQISLIQITCKWTNLDYNLDQLILLKEVDYSRGLLDYGLLFSFITKCFRGLTQASPVPTSESNGSTADTSTGQL